MEREGKVRGRKRVYLVEKMTMERREEDGKSFQPIKTRPSMLAN